MLSDIIIQHIYTYIYIYIYNVIFNWLLHKRIYDNDRIVSNLLCEIWRYVLRYSASLVAKIWINESQNAVQYVKKNDFDNNLNISLTIVYNILHKIRD